MKGFALTSTLLLWGGGAAAALILAGGAATWIQTKRLNNCKEEYATFVLKVKVAGESADKENRDREARELKLKEKTDAAHKTTVDRLQRDVKRLRDANASRSLTPEAPAGSKRPDLSCFDRSEFDRALRSYEDEVVGLLAEGAAATIDLNAAKAWAQGLAQ